LVCNFDTEHFTSHNHGLTVKPEQLELHLDE
jgi:hypothetical protein